MDEQVLMATMISLLTHMSLLMCHPATWRNSYQPLFLPGPQFCPDTGRTVCAAVDYYPTERIYNLLTSTRSQVFNITSLFVDERKGDTEPNTSQLIIHPPYYQNRDNYYAMQPPPSGRFSPAGRENGNRSGWNSYGGSVGDAPPWTPPNRWRLVPQGNSRRQPDSNGQQGTYDGGGGVRPQPGSEWRQGPQTQSDGQPWTNVDPSRPQLRRPIKLRTKNSDRNGPRGVVLQPPFLQQQPMSEDNGAPFPANRKPKNYDDNGYYVNQNSNGGSDQDTQVTEVFRRIPSSKVNRDQEHYGPPTRPATHSLTEHAWNDEQRDEVSYDQENDRTLPALRTEEPKYHNTVKRGRRNQDVEVACPVQSTFVPPRAALNDQSEWKYIVNVPERDQRFSQVVRVDVCLTEGQPCSSRLSLPFGFVSRCRQKYIKKKLLSLNPDGQGTAEDNFFIPSCCVCEIVRSNSK